MFDIVTVRTRTGKNEEFMSGGVVYIIDAKKGCKVPRNFADLALEQNALRWSKTSGGVLEATVYIEDDVEEAPKAITQEEIKAKKSTSGFGKGKILVDGKEVSMRAINLDPEA
jgi:hypothetical protein